MIVASVSWGNDSIALVRWLYERGERDVVCVYCDTGWASKDWPARVEDGERLARSYGFGTERLARPGGFVELARLKKAFPRNGMQFCTSKLKIEPFAAYLAAADPAGEATVAVGIRREESAKRATWPEWTTASEQHGGRDLWAPLVRVTADERDWLLARAGFPVLEHRSKECFPCVNSSRRDLRLLDEDRVREIEQLEASVGQTLFRAGKFMGARGIREIARWAQSERGQYEPPDESSCDSGFCGS